MKTIDDSVRESVRNFPDSIALRYYQDEEWDHITYGELYNAVSIIAHGIAELGAGHDSKIAIMCENRPEWVVSYFAIVTTGAVAIPIDAALGEIETEHILNHSGARTIICSLHCYEVVSRILRELDSLHDIIILDRNIIIRHEHRGEGKGKDLVDKGRRTNNHKNFMSYDELRESGIARLKKGQIEFHGNDLDDLASIIYTSGTTGTPKGVMLTHRNFMANIESILPIITVDERDNIMLLLPLHHSFPFTTCMLLPLAHGSTICFVDIMSRDRTRLIMECQPTIMVGVPLLYSKIYRGIIRQVESSKVKNFIFKYGGKKIIGRALKKKLGGKLRIMVSGAAPMDPSVIEGFVGLGIEFLEGYGLTETAPLVSANLIGKIKIGSVGPPVVNVKVKITNPDDEGIGEITISGPNVMQGYHKSPEQTKLVLKDGWFYSGDLGWMDDDDYIFITGRAKDVIVTRGGKNVYPDMVESVINKSRFIAESVVLGYRTDGLIGEDVGVLIFPDYEALVEHAEKENIVFTEEVDINALTEDAKNEIVETFRQLLESEVKTSMSKLANYQRVTRIGIERDEFTKTSTKKIKRFLYKGRLDIYDIGQGE